MTARALTGLVVLLCLALLPCVQAQNQTPPGPQSTAAPNQASATIDTQGIKNYLLGPGHLLDVKIFGQQDLSAVEDIDSDGNISSLPFIETPIRAKCRTARQLQKDIAAAYAVLLKNPQVSVRITDRRSRQPATVFGAVRAPTRIQMVRKVRLNEVMSASG